jgi:hypothetical protein
MAKWYATGVGIAPCRLQDGALQETCCTDVNSHNKWQHVDYLRLRHVLLDRIRLLQCACTRVQNAPAPVGAVDLLFCVQPAQCNPITHAPDPHVPATRCAALPSALMPPSRLHHLVSTAISILMKGTPV